MGQAVGSRGGARVAAPVLFVLATLTGLVACGSDDGTAGVESATRSSATQGGEDEDDPGDEGLRPCADDRHAVVVEIDGILTRSRSELAAWIADPDYDPAVRPFAPEMIRLWRQRGYEIVYLSERRAGTKIGGRPVDEATRSWMSDHDLPTGEDTQLLLWDPDGEVEVEVDIFKTQALLDLNADQVSVDYGYASSDADIRAYRSGGVDADHIFSVGAVAGDRGTVAIEDDNWLRHGAEVVDPLPPICDR